MNVIDALAGATSGQRIAADWVTRIDAAAAAREIDKAIRAAVAAERERILAIARDVAFFNLPFVEAGSYGAQCAERAANEIISRISAQG